MNRHTGRRLYTPPPFFVVFNWYTYFQIEYTQRPAKLPSLKFSKSNFKGENFCHMNVINMHTYVDVEIRISFSKKCVCKIACPRVIHGVRWSHTKSNLHTFHHVTIFSLMRSLDKLFFLFLPFDGIDSVCFFFAVNEQMFLFLLLLHYPSMKYLIQAILKSCWCKFWQRSVW